MASGTRVPVDTRESVSSWAWSFLGREGVSKEKEDNEAESQCLSEKYPSEVNGGPSPSTTSRSPLFSTDAASSSPSWMLLPLVGDSSLGASPSLLVFFSLTFANARMSGFSRKQPWKEDLEKHWLSSAQGTSSAPQPESEEQLSWPHTALLSLQRHGIKLHEDWSSKHSF